MKVAMNDRSLVTNCDVECEPAAITKKEEEFESIILRRRSRWRERLNAMGLSICLYVCLTVSLSIAKMQKRDFLRKKLSNLELWSLLTTYRS